MIIVLCILGPLVAYALIETAALRKRLERLEERLGRAEPARAPASAARDAAPAAERPIPPSPPAMRPPPPSMAPPPAGPPSAVVPPAAPAPAATVPAAPPPTVPPPPPPAVAFRTEGARAAPSRPAEPALSLEERIGSVWLRNIGLVLLAIGLAYFVNLVHQHLSAAGKIAVAYAFALGVFAVGASQQRRLERFARPVMIAGLTLAYFVAFAAHFVEATRCVSLPVALVWMAGGLIPVFLLADRWRSQAAAGLAFFLGHVSIFVATDGGTPWSLVAIAFLALLAAVLHYRHSWPPFSLFALVGSYAAHLLWFLVGRTGAGGVLTPTGLWVNVGFLSSYYGIFVIAEMAWWGRGGSGPHVDQLAARALGPANIVIYAAFVSFLYTDTPGAHGIHWFFLVLAAAQAILTRAYRRAGNPDADLYAALAVIFATIGACAYFDALALNEVLAAEALILLLAAHRTRLWLFHLLAQAVLALNFAHYWMFRPPTTSVSTILGGFLIVVVYLTKAYLEEQWYGGDARQEWMGAGEVGPLLRPVARIFDAVYVRVAPRLAVVHALGGGLIFVHEVTGAYVPNVAVWVFAVALLVLPAVARGCGSRALLASQLVVQVAVVVAGITPLAAIVLWPHAAVTAVDPWTGWAAAAAGWLALLGLVLTESLARRPDLDMLQELLPTATIALFTLGDGLPTKQLGLSLAWMAVVALVGATYDRLVALPALRNLAGGLRRWARIVMLAVAGPLVWMLVDTATAGAVMPSLVWLHLVAVAFLAAGLMRRDVVLLVAGAAALAGSLGWGGREIVDGTPALDWVIALALLRASRRRFDGPAMVAAERVVQAIVAIALGTAVMVAVQNPPVDVARLLPWVAALALGFATQDRGGGANGGRQPDVIALCSGLALVLWADVAAAIALPSNQGLWLQVVGVSLCAVAAFRRHLGFYVAGAVLVLATYIVLYLLHPFDLHPHDPATTFAIVSLTLGLAIAQDGLLARTSLAAEQLALARMGAVVPFALGLLLWTSEIGDQVGFPWDAPMCGGLALALLVVAGRIRGVVGTRSALAYLLLVELHALLVLGLGLVERGGADVLAPALVLIAGAIAFERRLASQAEVLLEATPRVQRATRAVIVGLAVAVGVCAAYRSSLFGTDHQWLTIGWALLAGIVMALGFAFQAGEYRRVALAAIALCVARAVVVDTQRLGDLAKPVTFVLLAICLLGAAWLYSRYAERIKDWI